MTADLLYLTGDPAQKIRWAHRDDVYGDPIYGGRRTIAHLEWTNRAAVVEFGVELEVLQGGFNTDVAASAGTHDLDGCVDLFIPGVEWWVQQAFFRRHGWAAWYRYPPLFGRHIHAISLGCPGRVGVYVPGQVDDYYRHSLGLKGRHNSGADTSWFPDDIDSTIFDFALWERELEDNMPYLDWPEKDRKALAADVAAASAPATVKQLLAAVLEKANPGLTVAQALKQAQNAPGLVRTLARKLGHNLEETR